MASVHLAAGSPGVCSVHCTVHYSWQPRGLKCTVYIEFNTAVHPTGTLQVCTLYYTLYCILDCSLCCTLHCILYCTLYCTLQLTAQRSVGKAAPRTALYSLLCIMYTDLYIRYTVLCIIYTVIYNMFTLLCIS